MLLRNWLFITFAGSWSRKHGMSPLPKATIDWYGMAETGTTGQWAQEFTSIG